MINNEFSEAIEQNIFININNNFSEESLNNLAKHMQNDEADLFPNRQLILNVNKDKNIHKIMKLFKHKTVGCLHCNESLFPVRKPISTEVTKLHIVLAGSAV